MESRDCGQFEYTSRITPDLKVISGDKTEEIKALKDDPDFKKKLVGTHSECFHCDDVLACSMLLYTKDFAECIIVRTRTETTFPLLDILVDVGSTFDSKNNRFDHHQRSFTTTFWDDLNDLNEKELRQKEKIKMSSAGLVYKFYGKEILVNILKEVFKTELEEKYLEQVYRKLYRNFFIEIDAIDNGVNEGENLLYHVNTNLSSRVGRMNKAWNDTSSSTHNDQFKKALKITEEEFLWNIFSMALIFIPARKVVQEAWDKRKEFHSSEELIYFETQCPWKEHLFQIEEELNKEGLIKFVFFKDSRGMCRVQAVPKKDAGFENRVSLSAPWRGLRGEELQEKSGFKDAEFVHNAGFIGGAWSVETCLQMALKSIEDVSKANEGGLKS